jgi:uncharacterized protein YndB with AHSA1/START domain
MRWQSANLLVMQSQQYVPTANVKLLIRSPVQEVFGAFTDPHIITKFWLSRASAPLEVGKTVRWDFMVEGATVETTVKDLVPGKRIFVQWSNGSTVEWLFEERPGGGTIVQVENAGLPGNVDEVIKAALESTQGFTIVLCDLKTLLESGKQMNLTRDKAALIAEAHAAT